MSAVRLRGLAAGYGDPPVVDGLELELPPGATLALVGTNGSGKSTILRTLAGLLDPRSGTVEVLEEDPAARRRSSPTSLSSTSTGFCCRSGLGRS